MLVPGIVLARAIEVRVEMAAVGASSLATVVIYDIVAVYVDFDRR